MSARPHFADAAPGSDASYLDGFEYRFRLRGQGPQPLSVDGRRLGHGLPRRRIPLTELAAILMHPSCSPEATQIQPWPSGCIVNGASPGSAASPFASAAGT